MKTTVLYAPDIMCGGCAASIHKALADVDGIGGVDIDVAAKHVSVTHDDVLVTVDHLVTRLDHAGFSASPVE
jgi:copper chaperone CopZ